MRRMNQVVSVIDTRLFRVSANRGLAIGVALIVQLTPQTALGQQNAFEINNSANYPALANAPNSIAIGGDSTIGSGAANSAALGFNTSVTVANSVAIGANAVASRGAQTYVDPFSGQTVHSVGEVSFGSSLGGAQLTNLAPGSATTDAATVGQVQSATSTALSSANTFTDNAVTGALSQAAQYSDTAASNALGSAEAYSDASSAATLSAAQIYASGVGTSTLASANNFTTTTAAATLSTAKSFATNAASSALSAATAYTDTSAAATLSAAQVYASGVGSSTLTSANNFTATTAATTLSQADSYAYSRTAFLATNSGLAPSVATGLETLALGGGAQALGNNTLALGSNAAVNGNDGLAAGYGATVLATGGVALGTNARVTAANAIALGTNSVAARGAQSDYVDPISGSTVSSAGEVSVGSTGNTRQITNVAAGSAPTDAANVAQVESAQAIAVNLSETYANAATTSLLTMLNSYGYNTSPSNGTNSIAIGNGATASGSNASAIGSNSSASANNSVALGAGSTAMRGPQTNYKDPISGNTANSVGEVSVGSPGAERQITNVAPGTAATDAANVGQLQAAITNAHAYTDTLFGHVSRQAFGVAASAQALADLPQAPEPGQSMLGMSIGTSHGEIGYAFGASYFVPDDAITIRASASYSDAGGISAGMGMGMILN